MFAANDKNIAVKKRKQREAYPKMFSAYLLLLQLAAMTEVTRTHQHLAIPIIAKLIQIMTNSRITLYEQYVIVFPKITSLLLFLLLRSYFLIKIMLKNNNNFFL